MEGAGAEGVVFPLSADGRRSTSALGRAVVADALRAVDPVGALGAERETNWRSGYLIHLRRLDVRAGHLPVPGRRSGGSHQPRQRQLLRAELLRLDARHKEGPPDREPPGGRHRQRQRGLRGGLGFSRCSHGRLEGLGGGQQARRTRDTQVHQRADRRAPAAPAHRAAGPHATRRLRQGHDSGHAGPATAARPHLNQLAISRRSMTIQNGSVFHVKPNVRCP
jgi:hypothetical protein